MRYLAVLPFHAYLKRNSDIKYVFSNKNDFQVEIWKMLDSRTLPHIYYKMETDLDEIIRRFARLHLRRMELANVQNSMERGL